MGSFRYVRGTAPLLSSWLVAGLLAGCSAAVGAPLAEDDARRLSQASTVDDLADQYAFFKSVFVDLAHMDQTLQVGAGFSPALATETLAAHGLPATGKIAMTMNAPAGLVTRIQATLDGFPLQAGAFDLWFVKNVPGSSILPEAGDTRVRVGTFANVDTANGELTLDVSPEGGLGGAVYDFDMVVVTRANQDPVASRVITGERTFFQKRFFREAAGIPMDAVTLPLANDVESIDPVVRAGSQVFFNETFGGNGRTCGTCHRREANLTITPALIATLPKSDPLFVAENNPALAQLENTALLHSRALIRENTDGFGNPPVQRFTNHLFALGTSLNITGQASRGFPASPPIQAVGRSSDGAPGGSSLHEFLLGAIVQHFPKTLNRVPGVDFRLPTQAEADVVEAFQLFNGRSHEVDTTALGFRDATATSGQALANSGQTGKCIICHASLQGIRDFFENFNQGANARVTDLPFDDGFRQPVVGTIPQTPPATEVPGNQLFNVTPLIEAADLNGFFHNRAVSTIEDAVTHYTTAAFANSPSGQLFGPINLTPSQIDDVANFLREVNALENIRQVRKRVVFVTNNRSSGNTAILNFAIADATDALHDLSQKSLNPAAQHDLQTVIQTLQITIAQPDANRPAFLANASAFLDAADSALLSANPNGEFVVH
jgi:cytochrome c peroxidase